MRLDNVIYRYVDGRHELTYDGPECNPFRVQAQSVENGLAILESNLALVREGER